MTKQSLFQHISKAHILQSLDRIDQEGYPAKRKSSTYNLVFNEKCYPPKYVTSLASFFASGDFLTHKQFGGGEDSVCFAFLRSLDFEILTKDKTKDITDSNSVSTDIQRKYVNRFRRNELDTELFTNYFEQYLEYANTTNWLTELEAYKFRFGRWLTSRIDFDSQSDQEILDIINESQEQEYIIGDKEKGINFVTFLGRFNDDFIILRNVSTLRKMRSGYMIEDWDLKDTPSTWPVFSVWAGLLLPEKHKIIAKADLMKGFIQLYNLDKPIVTRVRGFNSMNTYLNHLSSVIKSKYESGLSELLAKLFPDDATLHPSDLAWFTQDFMFYMDKHVIKDMPSYYWVNQGSQYDNELAHSCICADVESSKSHHKRLLELKQGDVLVHYADRAIQATSIVNDSHTLRPRPYLDTDKEEIVVETSYTLLNKPISIVDVQNRLRPRQSLLPSKHSPFDKNFGIVQAYCLDFNKPSFDILFGNKSNTDQSSNMKYPLNTILYGPPGTGKTYNSINYAIGMIEDKSLIDIEKEERSDLRKRYNEYVESGQIVFSTFHQSMSYEDFIEGIKPVMADEVTESGEDVKSEIRYEVRSGIFKELVEKSKDTSTILNTTKDSLFIDPKYFKENINKISLGNSQSPEDNEIYEYCIHNNCIALGWGEGRDYTGVESKADVRKIFETVEGHATKPSFNVDAIWRFVIWMKEGQLVFVPNGNKKLRAIGVVTGDYYYDSEAPIRYSQFRKVDWLYIDLDISIKSIYNKYFSQQSIYQMLGSGIDQSLFSKDPDVSQNLDKFVLIIDEINRGNVSQIFGELITLIEDDKRSGRKEALTIKLPYSKEDFSVPDNIHILGTMNTADRSVEALDSALRRRFSFVEMPSKPSLLTTSINKGFIGDIDLAKLLSAINLRVSKLIDSDHAIGHSYFFKITTKEELTTVFNDKVLPLLEEYFFGDLGKLGLVLGATFVTESNNSQSIKMKAFAGFGGNYTEDMNEKKVYKVKPSSNWNFKDIYSD